MVARHHRLLSDERLATLAADGSDSAFAVIYNRYDAVLAGYCRSITRNADDARDALQNAMVKAMLAIRRGQLPTSLRPWLFRIAHNEAIGVLQRRARTEPLLDSDVVGSVEGADEAAARRERMAEVVTDLHALPLSQRAALVMRELAGMPYDEIATALSVSEVNARQLVFSARTGLEDSRAGRSLPCESVRGFLATADGRELRRRPLRAHLRACAACRDFAADARSSRRRRRVAAVFAPLPGLPQSLVSALANSGVTIAETGSGALLAKGAAVVALIATAGVGTTELAKRDGDPEPASATAAKAEKTERPRTRAQDRAPAATTPQASAPEVRTVAAVDRPDPVVRARPVADEPTPQPTTEPVRSREQQPDPAPAPRERPQQRSEPPPRTPPAPEPQPAPAPSPRFEHDRPERVQSARGGDCPPAGDRRR